MNVFTALLGEAKGVFGKGFVFAGLLPAVLFMFGWLWFSGEGTGQSLLDEIAELIDSDKLGEFATSGLIVLSIALVLFATRQWVMRFLEEVPGRVFRGVRRYLVSRQVGGQISAERDEKLQIHVLWLVDKWTGEENFAPPPQIPTFEPVLDQDATRRASYFARNVFLDVVRHSVARSSPLGFALKGIWRAVFPPHALEVALPTRDEHDRIVHGLRCLCARVKQDGAPAWAAETSAWASAVGDPASEYVLRALRDECHRRWVASYRALDRFPSESKWIGPTQLGSKAAALDDYAEKRYGIDTTTLLTRLAGVIESSDLEGLTDSRLTVEMLVNLAITMAALAVCVLTKSLAWIVIYGYRGEMGSLEFDARAVVFAVCSVVLVFVFYSAAVRAYDGLAEKTKRIVDLNRLKLIEGLGFEVPKDMDEERDLWTTMNGFFWNGEPITPSPPLKSGE